MSLNSVSARMRRAKGQEVSLTCGKQSCETFFEACSTVYEVLEIAACLGVTFQGAELVESAEKLGITVHAELIEQLIEAGILGLLQADRYTFIHGQCREAFRRRNQNGQREVSVHSAIVLVLDSMTHVSAERRAYHLMLAGDFDRAAHAFSDAWTVVRRQERFASGHRIIISWARCLRRLDYTSEDRAWLELKSRWADLCFQQGFSRACISPCGWRHET